MTKKTTLRKDLTTRKMTNKSTLIRIVKTQTNEVKIDWNQKLPGRGAYVTRDAMAIKKLQKNAVLERALKIKVPAEIYSELLMSCN